MYQTSMAFIALHNLLFVWIEDIADFELLLIPLKGKFSSGTEFLIIFKPLGNCMIFKINCNFVILELIGQPYFDLKRNNSKNVWNKCLINCFIIDSLSSNLRDKTTHLSMQHCCHVVFYIIGTQYLHFIRHPGKDKSFRTCI